MNKIEITFSEEKLIFHFGLGFMGNLLESLDCSVDELMAKLDKNPFRIVPKLMYEAYSYGCLRKGEDVKHNLFEFTDLIDDDGGIMSEKTVKFLEAFTKSMTKDVPKEDVDPSKRNTKSAGKQTPKKK